MKAAANTVRGVQLIRRVALCSLFGMLLIGFTGCELGVSQTEEDICTFIENVAQSTEKALENRNTAQARDVWSDISEQGMKATDQGAEEIGKAISRLAGTYSELVRYCEDGEPASHETFVKNFRREAEKLVELIEEEGFDTTNLSTYIEDICSL